MLHMFQSEAGKEMHLKFNLVKVTQKKKVEEAGWLMAGKRLVQKGGRKNKTRDYMDYSQFVGMANTCGGVVKKQVTYWTLDVLV